VTPENPQPWWSSECPIGELYNAWWSEDDEAEELRLINEHSTSMLMECEQIANQQIAMNLRNSGMAVVRDEQHQELIEFRAKVQYVLSGRKGE
jgi:hypothetical protein